MLSTKDYRITFRITIELIGDNRHFLATIFKSLIRFVGKLIKIARVLNHRVSGTYA